MSDQLTLQFRLKDGVFVGATANYPKGYGDELVWWMIDYHPGAVLFPTPRACGGAWY